MNAYIEIQVQRGQASGKLEFTPQRELTTPQHKIVTKAFDRLIEDLTESFIQKEEAPEVEAVVEVTPTPEVPDKNEKPAEAAKGAVPGNDKAKSRLQASEDKAPKVETKSTPSAGVFAPPGNDSVKGPDLQPKL